MSNWKTNGKFKFQPEFLQKKGMEEYKAYKMRATQTSDLGQFLCKVSVVYLHAVNICFNIDYRTSVNPDLEVSFICPWDLDELRQILKKIVEYDGENEMLETLNLESEYTGENYWREDK